jgi:hypothetical protein
MGKSRIARRVGVGARNAIGGLSGLEIVVGVGVGARRSGLGEPVGGVVVPASGGAVVFVDESIKYLPAAYLVDGDRFRCGVVDAGGGALVDAAVGPVGVVVLEVLGEQLAELAFVPDQGVVEEFGSGGAHEAFGGGVWSWCAGWGVVDAVTFQDRPERGRGETVAEAGEFAVDAPVAPRRVLGGEADDELFSVAYRAGRPGRLCGWTHRAAVRRRCQASSVSGVTMNP